ncbi:MAG: hypothetical protein M1816_005879 [Peltula sp. TS41687]|nr:MAG: hypothetical protein M1816_005879 [Peltula sp. TS41687]
MDAAYNRHARRSNPNLHHLSLAPLTSKLPLNDEHELAAIDSGPIHHHHRPSYREAGKSAPATPATNLSRNPSSHRLRLKTTTPTTQLLPKSKSSSHLPPPHRRHNPNHGALRPLTTSRKSPQPQSSTSSEWLVRAGALLASEARESKGQSWLGGGGREKSSTSLVSYAGDDDYHEDGLYNNNDGDENDDAGYYPSREDANAFADDEFSPVSTRASASRISSLRTSRIGSKVELALHAGGPLKDVDDDAGFAVGPDFVVRDDEDDAEGEREGEGWIDEEEEEEDAEMDELTRRQQGSGVAGWLDRFMKWSLFAAVGEEEDEEELEREKEKENKGSGENKDSGGGSDKTSLLALRKPVALDEKLQQRQLHREGGGGGGGGGGMLKDEEKLQREEEDKAEGWQDEAAWLLSVASKVLM